MQKIQYLISSEVVKDMPGMAKYLEEKGNEGWILANMANMQGERYLFIFHRPKESEKTGGQIVVNVSETIGV